MRVDFSATNIACGHKSVDVYVDNEMVGVLLRDKGAKIWRLDGFDDTVHEAAANGGDGFTNLNRLKTAVREGIRVSAESPPPPELPTEPAQIVESDMSAKNEWIDEDGYQAYRVAVRGKVIATVVISELSSGFSLGTYEDKDGTLHLSDEAVKYAALEDARSAAKTRIADIRAQAAEKSKAPGTKKRRGVKGGKPGVIKAIVREIASAKGASVDEIVDSLARQFPERSRDSMRTTTRIQVHRWPRKHGFTVKKIADSQRGMVYRIAQSALAKIA